MIVITIIAACIAMIYWSVKLWRVILAVILGIYAAKLIFLLCVNKKTKIIWSVVALTIVLLILFA